MKIFETNGHLYFSAVLQQNKGDSVIDRVRTFLELEFNSHHFSLRSPSMHLIACTLPNESQNRKVNYYTSWELVSHFVSNVVFACLVCCMCWQHKIKLEWPTDLPVLRFIGLNSAAWFTGLYSFLAALSHRCIHITASTWGKSSGFARSHLVNKFAIISQI